MLAHQVPGSVRAGRLRQLRAVAPPEGEQRERDGLHEFQLGRPHSTRGAEGVMGGSLAVAEHQGAGSLRHLGVGLPPWLRHQGDEDGRCRVPLQGPLHQVLILGPIQAHFCLKVPPSVN